ncbi:MAG: quinone oxidoreductase [Rhodospirillales bacterium]|nr:quinone oxidoreductase [Rhodospirillales bacterium]
MTKAIRIHKTGGPDVLKWEDVEVGDPGPGQVLIRHAAVGLNFIDTYQRTGLYPLPAYPAVLGMEAAGKITGVGPGVTDFKVGQRVAYASGPTGAYSEERLMPADRVVALPDAIDDRTAAAMMLKGMTTEYLIRRTYPVKPGDAILLHAAAGGVGQILSQWANHLGATVIGTVGSEEKAKLARARGCRHTILYTSEDVARRVREITKGEGVAVAYDSVGKTTLQGSLDSLRPRGMMISFGNSSGPIGSFDPGELQKRGSLFFTRPSLAAYTAKRDDLLASAKALFDVVSAGHVKISVNQTYALKDTAQAHRDLEGRKTTGSTVLLP